MSWLAVTSINGLRCDECRGMVTRAWCWFERPALYTKVVCLDCAEKAAAKVGTEGGHA